MSRRVAAAALLAGLAAIGTGVTGMVAAAGATAAAGSGLGPIAVTATAAGVRMPLYSSSGEDVEGQAPWSTVSMSTGLTTHALTSVFWPGDTGGHGGDTLALLGASCIPPNPNGLVPGVPCVTTAPTPPASVYDSLNDPYKAEAQSGRGQPTVTGGGNGVTMSATALPTDAIATATIDASKVPAIGDTFGTTTTSTTVKATGPAEVTVDATSVLHDVSLGGGVIKISSVTSVAHAVSNTTAAVGSASTTVQGMTIGGVPVTVDDKGLHAGPANNPLPGTSQVNQALAQSGFKVFVAQPSRIVKGASITLDSGSLILLQSNPQYTSQANDTSRMLILGGTGIQANTGKGFAFNPGAVAPAVPPAAGQVGSANGAGGPPAVAGSLQAGGSSGSSPVVAQPPAALATQGSNLPGGVAAGWVVLTVLGSGLAGAGLRRLPDKVLTTDGPSCSLDRGTT